MHRIWRPIAHTTPNTDRSQSLKDEMVRSMSRRLNTTLDDEAAAILQRAVGESNESAWVRAAIIEKATRDLVGAKIAELDARVLRIEQTFGIAE